MPHPKLPPTGDAEFIAYAALYASDGRPQLAIAAARFVEVLERNNLRLDPDARPGSYTTRPDNLVNVTAQIDRNALRVSLYGAEAEHRDLHGADCAFDLTRGRTRSYTELTAAGHWADLAEHIGLAQRLRRRREVRLAA